MEGWLSRMRDALAGPSGGAPDVRRTLETLQRSRARLELEPLISTTGERTTLVSTVEVVRDDAFVIGRPTAEGVFRLLGRYEEFRMSFETPEGRASGRTQALGRVRIPTSGGDVLYGYRMAMPDTLHVRSERRALRTLLGRDVVREAELHVLGRKGPILGLVEDLDATGARLRCRNARVQLRRGQQAYFKITLPEPIGRLQEAVHVVSAAPDDRRGHLDVRVAFRNRNERIYDALRAERRRRSA